MKKSKFKETLKKCIENKDNRPAEEVTKDLFEFINEHMIPRNMIKVDLFGVYDNGWEPEND